MTQVDECPFHDTICGCPMYSRRQKGGPHFPDCRRGKARCACITPEGTMLRDMERLHEAAQPMVREIKRPFEVMARWAARLMERIAG